MLWGGSYAFQKPFLEIINPYTFTFWNFFISGVVLLMFVVAQKSSMTYRLKEGCVLGLLLAGMEISQMVGLKYASAADAAFISNLGMLIIPYIGWILFRHKISALNNVAILMAIAGLYLLVGGPTGLGVGQIILLVCAVLMALYFIYSERFEGEKNSHLPVLLVQQFFVTSLICAAVILVLGDSFMVDASVRVSFFWQILIFTMVPYILIQWGSRYADEMTATIYDGVVEPLVGGIAAWVIMAEPTTRESVTGALIMVVAFALGSIFANEHFFRRGKRAIRSLYH